MLRNYVVGALRELARNQLYAAISILGLAVGLCAATLAGLTLRNDLTWEHFIPGYENTYLAVGVAAPTGHTPLYSRESPAFVAGILTLNLRQIRAVTRIAAADVHLRHDQVEAQERIYWADSNAFDVLRLPVFAGDPVAALRRPDGIILTRRIAAKYFGRDDAVGQSIVLDDAHVMTVTAVIEDLPVNATSLETGIFASGLGSYSRLSECDREAPELASRNAVKLCGSTYLQLGSQPQLDALQRAIDALLPQAYPKFPGMTFGAKVIRIDRVHLFDGLNPGIQARLAAVGAVALVILFAACVVFVNLSTARSVRRALEVGVRKACGASRAQLIVQFLGESVLYVVLAACVALALAEVTLPYVNAFLDSGSRLDLVRDPELLASAIMGVLVVGVLAGAYPAFVLSAFRPNTVLKGVLRYAGGAMARQSLVVLQFAILIGLVLTAAVIYRQCLYATRDALRVDVDQMLIIRSDCKPVLLNELRALPGVRGAYCSSPALLDRQGFLNARLRDGSNLAIDVTALEFGAFGLYGIKPVAGVLPLDAGQDGTGPIQNERQVVINETAARRFGFAAPAAAIGEPLPLTEGPRDFMAVARRIVAVVPDFSFEVAAQKVRPTLYSAEPNGYKLINVRLTGRDIPETLEAIDRLGSSTGAAKPPERFFVSEYIQSLYSMVLREAQVFAVFAGVSLVLAALGLLGLSAATAASRTREIGIRKAMGASTADIMRMLLWEFSTPIFWASLLAWPVSGLLLRHWLDGFADHVELGPGPFVAASALALGVALLTVAGHAFLIARAKPVAALRYE